MQSPGFLVETAASWAPCTSRGRCEASRSPGPARSHGQAAPNLAGAGSPRQTVRLASSPSPASPATRPPPGTVLALFPRGPRSEDRDTGFLSSDTTVLSACRCSARTSLWTLSSSAGGARLLAAAGFQRFLSLPPGWGSRGACSLFGPHPPESSKPLPLTCPGLGMAPRPEAHEPIRHLCEPLKCHGDKEGSQVQKGSLEGVRMNASETLQDVPDGDAPAVSWYHGAGSPRRLGTSIAAPAQPPKRPFLCRLCLWQGEEGTHLTWDTLGTQTSRPEAARGVASPRSRARAGPGHEAP